jgi:SnoaL-like domain
MAMSDHDVLAIMSTINLYGLAVDTQRWELFDRIFSDDVDADFGTSHWRDLAISGRARVGMTTNCSARKSGG